MILFILCTLIQILAGRSGDKGENGLYEKYYLYALYGRKTVLCLRLPKEKADVIYLCFPNNPSIGVTASKEQLKVWVDYALENHSLILSIRHMKHLLQMILQNRFMKLRALRNVLLSFVRSLKQPALQVCAAAIPLFLRNLFFDGTSLNPLWARRQATKFNGVSYVTQRAAEAVYSEEGRKQTKRGYCVL